MIKFYADVFILKYILNANGKICKAKKKYMSDY